jgi:hypothetical protein
LDRHDFWSRSAQMITTAIAVNTDGAVVVSPGATYGILLAILLSHAFVCSAATNVLARLNIFYVIVNGERTGVYAQRRVLLRPLQSEPLSLQSSDCWWALGIVGCRLTTLSQCTKIIPVGPTVSLRELNPLGSATDHRVRRMGISASVHGTDVDADGIRLCCPHFRGNNRSSTSSAHCHHRRRCRYSKPWLACADRGILRDCIRP